jgi:hypothetical protein
VEKEMTVRKGMADYRQAGAGGIIFVWLLQGGSQEMTYEQRKILYRSTYSAIVSKLRVTDTKEHEDELKRLVKETEEKLTQARKDYKSSFESHSSSGDLENNYSELLAQIFDNLWDMAIYGKMIESVQIEMDKIER